MFSKLKKWLFPWECCCGKTFFRFSRKLEVSGYRGVIKPWIPFHRNWKYMHTVRVYGPAGFYEGDCGGVMHYSWGEHLEKYPPGHDVWWQHSWDLMRHRSKRKLFGDGSGKVMWSTMSWKEKIRDFILYHVFNR